MHSMLPSSSTDLERAIETTIADRFDVDIPLGKLWSAQDCPIALLPYLARSLSVDYWDNNWSEKIKRQVVENSAYVHRHKGTPSGMKRALASLNLGVTISEWFQHGGDAYTFRADVDITGRGITAKEIRNIHEIISTTKNARSHLERLRIYLTAPLRKARVITLSLGQVLNIGAYIPTVPPQTLPRGRALVLHTVQTITIGAAHV